MLLIGAGYDRRKAFLMSLLVEAATMVGGGLGYGLLTHVSPALLAAVAAHIAGGFLYIVGSVSTGAREGAERTSRRKLGAAGALSFLTTFVFILLTAR